MSTKTQIWRVLIIEDNAEDRRTLADLLKSNPNIKITFAVDGKQGYYLLFNSEYDLVILDLDLPHIDGRTLLVEARKAGIRVPVMILTGSKDKYDEPDNMDDGATAYFTKPYWHRALLSHINALLRDSVATTDTIIRFKNITFDTFHETVSCEGITPFKLKGKLSKIFATLLRCKSRTVTPEILVREAWEMGKKVPPETVNRNVNRINEKFEEHGLPRVVKCNKEIGYELIRD